MLNDDKTEYKYSLTTPIKYAVKGEEVTAEFITLLAPTAKQLTECARLRQFFFRALPQGEEKKEENGSDDKAEDINAVEIMAIISMSKDVDLDKVLVTARDLFTAGGAALVDGETKLTKPLFDALSLDDVMSLVGEYLRNFVVASSLNTLRSR